MNGDGNMNGTGHGNGNGNGNHNGIDNDRMYYGRVRFSRTNPLHGYMAIGAVMLPPQSGRTTVEWVPVFHPPPMTQLTTLPIVSARAPIVPSPLSSPSFAEMVPPILTLPSCFQSLERQIDMARGRVEDGPADNLNGQAANPMAVDHVIVSNLVNGSQGVDDGINRHIQNGGPNNNRSVPTEIVAPNPNYNIVVVQPRTLASSAAAVYIRSTRRFRPYPAANPANTNQRGVAGPPAEGVVGVEGGRHPVRDLRPLAQVDTTPFYEGRRRPTKSKGASNGAKRK